jgi:hypothetical protein
VVNCTVNDPDLQKGINKLKYESGEGVRQYVKESRCFNKPGSKRTLVSQLPAEDEYLANGDVLTKRAKTKTVRKSN